MPWSAPTVVTQPISSRPAPRPTATVYRCLDAAWALHFSTGVLTFRSYAVRKLAYALSPRVIPLLREYLLPSGRHLPLPSTLTIDVCNGCNLACPLCATGRGTLGRPRAMLTLERFRRVLDQVPGLRQLNLFDWGEPLLNPDVFSIVRCAAARGIRTNLHSNFSVPLADSAVQAIVASGLTDLVLSIDGLRQESYAKYRRGGDLGLVLHNLDRLLAAKRSLRSPTPVVTWKFLENIHNTADARRVARLCHRLGIAFHRRPIDTRRTVDDVVTSAHVEPPGAWLTARHLQARPPSSEALLGSRCIHLWFRPVVRPDLGVAPCCNVSRAEHDFGSLESDVLDAVWNNDRFRYARSLFTPNPIARPAGGVVCERCDLVIAYRTPRRPAGESTPRPSGASERPTHGPPLPRWRSAKDSRVRAILVAATARAMRRGHDGFGGRRGQDVALLDNRGS